MSDERPPGSAPGDGSDGQRDASDWLASQFDQTGQHEPVSADPPAPIESVDSADGPQDVPDPAEQAGTGEPTVPLVPRQLPSAASFFGEPRPPRHSAHVEPPASAPVDEPQDPGLPTESGLPHEQPATEPVTPVPAADAPAEPDAPAASAPEAPAARAPEPDRPEQPEPIAASPAAAEPAPSPFVAPEPAVYVPPPAPEPAEPASPHPMALDLSAIQGGDELLGDPAKAPLEPAGDVPRAWHLGDGPVALDAASLPAHDADGETPTAAFGAVFGSTPTAPDVPPLSGDEAEGHDVVAPSGEPASFTELISVGSDAPAPTAEPTSFNWSDLPEPHTSEIRVPASTAESAMPESAMPEPEPESEPEPEPEPEPLIEPEPEPRVEVEPTAAEPHHEPESGVESAGESPAAPWWAGLPTAVDGAPASDPDVPAESAPAVESGGGPTFTEILAVTPGSGDDSAEPVHAAPEHGVEAPSADDSQASTVVWSLDDPAPVDELPATQAMPVQEDVVPPSGVEPVGSDAAVGPEPAAETDPPTATDPFAVLFGETAAEPEPADDVAAAPGGADASWADEARPPIPPALEPHDSPAEEKQESDAEAVDAPTVAYTPPADTTPVTPDETPPVTPVDTPTVAYTPPVAGVSSGTTPASTSPVSPTVRPGAYRGPSSREVTPIDAANIPASWAAAAPAGQAASAPGAFGRPQAPQASAAGDDQRIADGWSGGGGFGSWSRQRRLLLFVGIVVVFVLVLVALFFVGKSLVGNAATPAAVPTQTASRAPSAAPTKTTAPTATTTPSPSSPAVAGPAAAGTHPWSDLQGGECLGSFTNAWQDTYQVVDCTAAHPAQMLAKGTVSGTTWPGLTALAAQVGPECQSSSVIDFTAAKAYTDVQVSASYPATQAEWDAGDHSYYCFVSRSSGQAIAGSLKATP